MALLSLLAFIAVVLTWAMFSARESMLGFPCVIFWALVGGQAYTLSATPWGDIYYYLFYASLFGMTTFTALAAFGLREIRDTIAEEELETGDEGKYFDEGKSEGETEPSSRTKALRERAEKRRTGEYKRPRRIKWH